MRHRSPVGLSLLLLLIATFLGCKKEQQAAGPEGTLGEAGRKLLAEKSLDVPGKGTLLDLGYRYDPAVRVRYKMSIYTDLKINVIPGGEQTIEMDLGLEMFQQARGDGEKPEVEYGFEKQEATFDMVVQGTRVHFDVKGRNVVGTADGREVVNTEKGVGAEIAKKMLEDFDFEGKKATARCDRRGRSEGLTGDKAVLDMLQDNSGGEGVLPLVFPEDPVVVGVPWWSKFEIHKLQNVDLGSRPIEGMVRFVVVDPAFEKGGKELVKIRMDAPMVVLNREAKAELDQLPGQEAEVTIERLERNGGGTILFDARRGVMVEAEVKVKLDARMKMKVMSQRVRMNMGGKLRFGFKEIPAAAAPPVE